MKKKVDGLKDQNHMMNLVDFKKIQNGAGIQPKKAENNCQNQFLKYLREIKQKFEKREDQFHAEQISKILQKSDQKIQKLSQSINLKLQQQIETKKSVQKNLSKKKYLKAPKSDRYVENKQKIEKKRGRSMKLKENQCKGDKKLNSQKSPLQINQSALRKTQESGKNVNFENQNDVLIPKLNLENVDIMKWEGSEGSGNRNF